MSGKNAIVCPLIYEGTSFEDIAKALRIAAERMDFPIEFIGSAEPRSNTLKPGLLDDHDYVRHQAALLGELIERTDLERVLFIDFFQPGIDLVRYAFEQEGKNCKFGSLLHGGSFLQGDLYSMNWLSRFENAWAGLYETVYVPSKHLQDRCGAIAGPAFKVFPWGMDGLLPDAEPSVNRDIDVIFPHRLDADKGMDDLLAITSSLPEVVFAFTTVQPDTVLQENPYAAELRQHGNVRFFAAQSVADHYRLLERSKVVLSCAKQENFGYAVMKAVERGCLPVLPKRLCYPEFFNDEYLYIDTNEAIDLITNILANKGRMRKPQDLQKFVRDLSFVPLLEDYFELK